MIAGGELMERAKHMLQALAAIRRQMSNGTVSGALPCPRCNSGLLLWRAVGRHRHVHAACSTPECLKFME